MFGNCLCNSKRHIMLFLPILCILSNGTVVQVVMIATVMKKHSKIAQDIHLPLKYILNQMAAMIRVNIAVSLGSAAFAASSTSS
jgi:predicted glycosyltransferase involved in capsule biosynthesis